MALSFNYLTKTISVPQADLTFVSGTFYTCDTNWLKNQILAELGSESGIWENDIYLHNTEVGPIAGTTFARTIQIINGWQIEFTPNSQWTVQLEGSNNDIWSVGDGVLVQNQVQVIPTNSAGLIVGGSGGGGVVDTYDGMVVIDTVNGSPGTASPIGTRAQPSDNIADALTIAATNGLTELYFRTDYNITSGDVSGFTLRADTPTVVDIDLAPAVVCNNTILRNVDLSGTVDALVTLEGCQLTTLAGFSGYMVGCNLEFGTITLAGGQDSWLLNCYTKAINTGMPTIDMGGSGQGLLLNQYSGSINITNKTGADLCSISLAGGEVTLDNTVTGGTVTLRGVGVWANEDTYAGGATVVNHLIEPGLFPAAIDYDQIWDTLLSSGLSAESELITASQQSTTAAGQAAAANSTINTVLTAVNAIPYPDNAAIAEILKAHFNRRVWDKVGDTITIYQDDGVTPFKVFDTNSDLSEIDPQ